MILKKSADDKKNRKITTQGGGGAESYSVHENRELRTYRIHMYEVTIKACMHSYLVG